MSSGAGDAWIWWALAGGAIVVAGLAWPSLRRLLRGSGSAADRAAVVVAAVILVGAAVLLGRTL